MTERRGIADILVAKHRNGPTGTFCLSFEPQTTRFRDVGDATIAPLPPLKKKRNWKENVMSVTIPDPVCEQPFSCRVNHHCFLIAIGSGDCVA
jgi:DnaB-like helicase C terminal domain